MRLHRASRSISYGATPRTDKVAVPRQGSSAKTSLTVAARGVVPLLAPVLLFLLAFILRAWGARFGLPEAFYHPDEHAIVERASAILRTGDYSPHWFNYPSAYIYIQALTYIPYFLISAARGFGNTIPSTAPYGFYFAGRLMTALTGALTVPLVYVLAKRMFGRRAGMISAVLLTFSLLHVVHSHYVTTDVPLAFFVTLSLLFSYLALEKGELRYTVLAGLFAGLATSTKYPGIIAYLPVLLVQFFTVEKRTWGLLGQRLGLTVGAFLAGFFLGTPYAFLELNTFLNSLGAVLGHYSATQPGFEGRWTGIWYLSQMLTSADVLVIAISLGGVAWALLRHTRKDLLLLSFVVPYYVLVSIWRIRFERNVVALLPLLAILGARFLVEGASSLARKWPAMRKWETLVLFGLVALAVAMPAWAIVGFDDALSQRDHRTIAAEWVKTNIPAGSKVVTEAFSIPLDEDRFQVVELVRIDSEELEWYGREDIEYVIVSDGHWSVLSRQRERYAREIATYNDILGRSSVLEEFSTPIPPLLARGYPTILIYHFPEVLILGLE
jgi:4-amino-4-deoxy-L-arabinose transferase-like glycosyltransferase